MIYAFITVVLEVRYNIFTISLFIFCTYKLTLFHENLHCFTCMIHKKLTTMINKAWVTTIDKMVAYGRSTVLVGTGFK